MMAMFFIPIVLFSYFMYKFKRWKFMFDDKQNAIKEGRDFYTDINGLQRKVIDDRAFFIGKNPDGDWCEYNPYTNEIRKNISEEKRNKMYDENRRRALENGELFFLIDDNLHFHDKIRGKRYMCTEDGEIYVRRQIGGILYMRVSDGMFSELGQNDIYGKEKIRRLNESQKHDFCSYNHMYF